MGAYFTLRTAKKAPLFLPESVRQTDPKVTLRSGKLMAKAFAASFEDKDREAVARSFTTTTIETYWNKIQEGASFYIALPEFFAAQQTADLPDTALSLAKTMGEAASVLDPLAASYLISVTYTAMLPDEMRSRLGAYYTPPPLAERLVSMATSAGINWKTCRVLDPACGGGAFLSAVAAPMVNAAGHAPPAKTIASVARRLKGFEIDPYAAWLSQTFLEVSFMPLCQQARGLATTSSLPRYELKTDFAKLFNPALSEDDFEVAAATWLEQHLSATALARTVLMRRGATTTGEGILVTFPNGETRRMAPGPSSIISKAVIDEFSKRYLINPAVLWVSESGAKVVSRDDELAAQLKLKIAADRNLPDIILVDLGDGKDGHVLLIFIEVVATDGPVTRQRQEALLKIATDAGFPKQRVAFVTAYLDRSHAAFKKTVAELAWRSFAWFAAEPEHLIVLHDGQEETIKSLAQWL